MGKGEVTLSSKVEVRNVTIVYLLLIRYHLLKKGSFLDGGTPENNRILFSTSSRVNK